MFPATAELLALPWALIRAVPGCTAAYDFQFVYVNSPTSDIGDYLVSKGPYLMVLTSVIALLPLAAPCRPSAHD